MTRITDDELPDGWARAPIGMLCDLKNGRAFKPTEWSTRGLPIVRIQNLNNSSAKFNFFEGEPEEHYLLQGGELLFAWSGTPGTSFGAHVWGGGGAVLNQHIFRVDFDEGELDKRFFRFAINQKLDELISVAHGGVGLRHVTKGTFENTEISLPPLPEQKRIADKLEALLGRVEACRARLDRISDILKRFRQSVLAAATSGRLTEDWREERKRKHEWDRSTVGSLITSIEAGLNVLCDERPPAEGEKGLVKISAVTWGTYDDDKSKTLPSQQDVPNSCRIKVGDFLISRANTLELVGACVIVHKVTRPVYLSDKILRLVMPDEIKSWLLHVLQSPSGRKQIEELASGNQLSMRNLSQSNLRQIAVPVPPDDERIEIVRRVEALFAIADRIEARVATARAQVDRLTPAILAKAFRGELVPQDPADEPASVLLERLRQQPAAVKPVRRGRRSAQAVEAAPVAESLAATESRAKPLGAGTTPARPPSQPSSPSSDEKPKAPIRRATPRADLDKNDLMAVLRAVVGEHGSCDRATAIQLAAQALGYQRVGKVVGAEIDKAIRTAVRRYVLLNDGEGLCVNPSTLAEMETNDREFMKAQLLAALSQHGRVWVERDDAPRLLAAWFGFHRASPQIQETTKSLINGLIRDHRLEIKGTAIRRSTT